MIKVPLNVVIWSVTGAALMLVIWLWWLWSPARQAEFHTLNFLRRASARNWTAAGKMMSPDYRDAWNADREQALRKAGALGRHFFTLQIAPVETVQVSEKDGAISASARLGIYGAGTPVANVIVDEMRALKGPFVFHWKKCGPWPWQWMLTDIGQEELAARFPDYDTGMEMP